MHSLMPNAITVNAAMTACQRSGRRGSAAFLRISDMMIKAIAGCQCSCAVIVAWEQCNCDTNSMASHHPKATSAQAGIAPNHVTYPVLSEAFATVADWSKVPLATVS